jgi:hypothetical protein
MAQVPLNYFVRQSSTLNTTLTRVYSAPFDTAAIMLTILAANTTSSPQTVTVGVSGLGGQNVSTLPYFNVVKDLVIPPNDTTNIAIGKIVLNEYDAMYANCNNSNSVDLTLSILETLNIPGVE